METAYDNIEKVVFLVTRYTALAIEIIGALVLVFAVGRALYCLCRRDIGVRLKLAQGIALALEFKIGGELLRTVYVRNWNELLILGAVILIRAAMTFLIHWEIRVHQKDAFREIREVKNRKKRKEKESAAQTPE